MKVFLKNNAKHLIIATLFSSFVFVGIQLFVPIRYITISTTEAEENSVPIVEKAIESAIEEVKDEDKEEVIEPAAPVVEEKNYRNYRLTSFYANDGYGTTSCTGSGLCTDDFSVNERGWYEYNGKLVLASATPYLFNYGYNEIPGRRYFRYYEEIEIIIDGVTYTGIILDSCGASMTVNEDRLDLFVAEKNAVIDRGYNGNNPISVAI